MARHPTLPAIAALAVLAAAAVPLPTARAQSWPWGATVEQPKVRAQISPQDCRWLVEHVPDPDVAYTPGVDVHGRPVVPADLPATGPQLKLPKEIVLLFEVVVAERLGLMPGPGVDLTAELGWIQVRGNRVYINGRPLDDEAQVELARRCRRATAR